MFFLVYVLVYVIIALTVLINTACQVQKPLLEGRYSWRNFALIALAWLVLIVPGIQTSCGPIGCRYSVTFTWLTSLLSRLPVLENVSLTSMFVVLALIVALLTPYLLGHILGIAFYGLRRLFGAGRRPA
jgi:hypothetical protein